MVDLEQILRNRVVYEIPGMDQVTVRRDIAYKMVDGSALMFDVYSPPNAGSELLPAVIFVHGDGAPERLVGARSWGQYEAWGELIGASGMRAVVANHRSSLGHTHMQDPTSDVDDLIKTVRQRADEFGIDRDRLAIWMCSAGGLFGMRAALRGNPSYVKAIVAYYALMDLLHLRETIPPLLDDDTIREYSPTFIGDEVGSSAPPIFMVKAAHDSPHFNASMDRFVSRAEGNGVNIRFITHPNGRHGFDIFDNDQTSREIIEQTLEFLKQHLL